MVSADICYPFSTIRISTKFYISASLAIGYLESVSRQDSGCFLLTLQVHHAGCVNNALFLAA